MIKRKKKKKKIFSRYFDGFGRAWPLPSLTAQLPLLLPLLPLTFFSSSVSVFRFHFCHSPSWCPIFISNFKKNHHYYNYITKKIYIVQLVHLSGRAPEQQSGGLGFNPNVEIFFLISKLSHLQFFFFFFLRILDFKYAKLHPNPITLFFLFLFFFQAGTTPVLVSLCFGASLRVRLLKIKAQSAARVVRPGLSDGTPGRKSQYEELL